MSKNGYHTQVRLMKMVGHPARWQILNLLRSGEECVCHLTAALHQRQAYVSQQLMFLRQAGLIEDRKDGLRVYYRVKDPRLFHLLDAVNAVAGVERVKATPQVLAGCPCPKCETSGQARTHHT